MSLWEWGFDGLLGLTLLWLAGKTLFTQALFNAILSFIGLGMLMALAWVRLGAPDVALAEAALGGGVTGALLLAAFNRLQQQTPTDAGPASGKSDTVSPPSESGESEEDAH